jgi:hypothetical protein
MPLTERGKEVVAGKIILQPVTESDQAFKIALASELVFCWQDARKDGNNQLVEALERVMCNIGIDREVVEPPPDVDPELFHSERWVVSLSQTNKLHLAWID